MLKMSTIPSNPEFLNGALLRRVHACAWRIYAADGYKPSLFLCDLCDLCGYSSSQVNAAPFLFFDYALAVRSQGITGFGSKKIGISLAKIISEETSVMLMRRKMNDFRYLLAQEGELS